MAGGNGNQKRRQELHPDNSVLMELFRTFQARAENREIPAESGLILFYVPMGDIPASYYRLPTPFVLPVPAVLKPTGHEQLSVAQTRSPVCQPWLAPSPPGCGTSDHVPDPRPLAVSPERGAPFRLLPDEGKGEWLRSL